MIVITYVIIPTYKYPSKLLQFFTPSPILTLLIITPYESLSFLSFFNLYFDVFFFFFSLYLGVKRGQSWGKK